MRKGMLVKVVALDGTVLMIGTVEAVNGSWTQVNDPRGGSDEWPTVLCYLA